MSREPADIALYLIILGVAIVCIIMLGFVLTENPFLSCFIIFILCCIGVGSVDNILQ